MKLAVSNLAWSKEENQRAFELLNALGVRGIEIAPAKIFEGLPLPPHESVQELLCQLRGKALAPIALQSFLFRRGDLRLFDDAKRGEMLEYVKDIVLLSENLGVSTLVYGAPASRNTMGRTLGECRAIAKEFFKEIGDFSFRHGVVFCIEPNPPQYGCDFIVRAKEGADMVRAVASPGFGLHLDVACMSLVNDDIQKSIEENADILRHFHVSEPNLSDFSIPQLRENHRKAANALKKIAYGGWISIEMLPSQDSLGNIKTAISFVQKTYLQ